MPTEVTNEEENRRLNRNINLGRAGGGIGGMYFFGQMAGGIFGLIAGALFPPAAPYAFWAGYALAGLEGNNLVNNRVNNSKGDETIKAIKSSFKECIENITGDIIDEYKKNFGNYELLKVEDLLNLIESIEDKIIKPDNKDISIVDLFEKYIYGNT